MIIKKIMKINKNKKQNICEPERDFKQNSLMLIIMKQKIFLKEKLKNLF